MFMILLGAATINYILVAICHRQSIAVLRNFHQVIFIVPIYISVFVPNAYGTIGDVNIKILNNPTIDAMSERIQLRLIKYRTKFITTWFLLNFAVAIGIIGFSSNDYIYIGLVCVFLVVVLVVKQLTSIIESVKVCFKRGRERWQ
jgi:hypothetical protein